MQVPAPTVRPTILPAKMSLASLLAYDSDPDGEMLTLAALDTTSAQGGTITLDNGG